MAKKPYSVCGLVRKTMGVRGTTSHPGRGYFELEHGIAADELLARLEAAITKWQGRGLVLSVDRQGTHTRVTLAKHLTSDGYYTNVCVTNNADLYVGM